MNPMSRPVLPPIRPRAFPTLFAAPLMAGPADDVTFDRPSEAFDLNSVAVCEAFEAVSFAASVALAVVDSNRRDVRPVNREVCRSITRDADIDMIKLDIQETEVKWLLGCPTAVGQTIGCRIVLSTLLQVRKELEWLVSQQEFWLLHPRDSSSRATAEFAGKVTIVSRFILCELRVDLKSLHLSFIQT